MDDELLKAWEPLLVRCRRRGMRRFVLREGVASWEEKREGFLVQHSMEGLKNLSDYYRLLLFLRRMFRVPSPGFSVILSTRDIMVEIDPVLDVTHNGGVDQCLWLEVLEDFGDEELDLLAGRGWHWFYVGCAVLMAILTAIQVIMLLRGT